MPSPLLIHDLLNSTYGDASCTFQFDSLFIRSANDTTVSYFLTCFFIRIRLWPDQSDIHFVPDIK